MLAPWSLWLALFYATPLGFILLISFWRMDGDTLRPAFTLHNYESVFSAEGHELALLLRTSLTALLVVAIVIALTYPVAYFLAVRMRSAGRVATALVLVALPFLVGPLVRAIAWKGLLGVQGVVNEALVQVGLIDAPIEWLLFSRFTVVLSLVYNTYPFMLFALVLSLQMIDRNLIAAARDLGSGAWGAFKSVVLPLSAPGLIVGSVLTFVPAVSASVEPEILGGPNSRFVTNAISDKFLLAVDWPAASALTVCFTLTALIVGGLLVLVLAGAFRRAIPLGGTG